MIDCDQMTDDSLKWLIGNFLLKKRVVTKNNHWILNKSFKTEYPRIIFCGISFSLSTLSAIAFLNLKLNENFNVPDGINICHKNFCHYTKCFNPDHLYIGTPLSNSADRSGKDGIIIAEKIFLSRLKKEIFNIEELLKLPEK